MSKDEKLDKIKCIWIDTIKHNTINQKENKKTEEIGQVCNPCGFALSRTQKTWNIKKGQIDFISIKNSLSQNTMQKHICSFFFF